jgi:hypothetical protein
MTEKWRTDPEPGKLLYNVGLQSGRKHRMGTPFDRVSFPKPVFVMFEAYSERLSERFPVIYCYHL